MFPGAWEESANEKPRLLAGVFWFRALALVDNGCLKLAAQIFGELVQFRSAINFDRPLGRVADHVAVVTPSEMLLQLRLGAIVHGIIQVVGKLF